MARGVANPKLQGQATTKMVTKVFIADVKPNPKNKYTKNASEAFTLGTLSDNGNFSIAAGSTSNAEEAAGIITLTPKAKDDNGADVTVTGKVSAQGVITWSDITK